MKIFAGHDSVAIANNCYEHTSAVIAVIMVERIDGYHVTSFKGDRTSEAGLIVCRIAELFSVDEKSPCIVTEKLNAAIIASG